MSTRSNLRDWRLLVAFAAASALLAAAAAEAAEAADATEPLRLSTAVTQALASHPTLAVSRARLADAQEAIGEARAAHGPVARLLLSGTEYRGVMPVTPIHGFGPGQIPAFDDTLVGATLNLSYTLFDSGARRERLRQATAQLDAGSAALSTAAQTLAARIATAWTGAISRQETLAAQRTRVGAVRAELARVETLLAAGRAPEVERLRAEAALASAEAEEARLATALDSAERDLARLLGLPPEATRVAALAPLRTPDAPTSAREALQSQAVAASPAVAQARAALAAAEAARALARTAYFPDLRATGAVQELAGADLAFSNEWNVGLALSVPLWDGGATDRRVARAGTAIDEARARLAQAELDVREAVDRALAGYADADARSAALGRAEARLVEVARIQKLLLEVGSGTQVDYLAAEAELAGTRAALAEAASAARVARVELARATGEISPAWLAENLESPQ